ncbi:MAG: Crp/Fnr family transcriptional regulator [Clostridiales bacterium]|nr:Crp/Fnr family transcriptional regulator [Clostridiales bacterium]MDD7432786.1 Crp/Fnr family transcriptional regulator [Clostridiales bacterium]MDY3061389.1 Crp/Fnr family transcriptional regulator [Eubacteriales bacterium]
MDTLFLKNTQLFRGIKEDEIAELLHCLAPRERKFQKDEVIFRAGSPVNEIGLVESGSVNIVVNLYWGNSIIFGHVGKGEVFAENFAAIPGKELVCDVVACAETEVLFLNMQKLLTTCERACAFHTRLIMNMLRISAQKNLNMSSRMMHTASRSLRERLLSYFSEQALEHGSPHFTIPFNRQQLAEYLGVNRSAMSNELSKMQEDGFLTYHRNEFTLKETIHYE